MGSIVEMTEDQISNLEGISVEFIYCSQKKNCQEKINNLRDLWDNNNKGSNIYIIRVPDAEEKESRTEKVFKEIMTQNIPEDRSQQF